MFLRLVAMLARMSSLPIPPWMLLGGLLLSTGASVANEPEIEYAAPEPSIWTIRSGAHDDVGNPLYAFAERLFARAGIPWHLRSYPAARMFRSLEDGTAQFSILVASPALEPCCLISRKPVAVAEIHVFCRAGIALPEGREGLAARSVITVRGYGYGGLKSLLADPERRIVDREAPDHAAAFRMLATGRGDCLLDYAGPAAEMLAREPLPGVQERVFSQQKVHLVLARSYPDAAKVMARLESIADALGPASVPARFGKR